MVGVGEIRSSARHACLTKTHRQGNQQRLLMQLIILMRLKAGAGNVCS
jgi:hypothetical protein